MTANLQPLGRRAVLATAATAAALGPGRAQPAAPTVEVTGGKLRGAGDGRVSRFKGIPYATAARFQPPQAAAPWPGVREATAFGPSAPQPAATTDPLSAWYGALEPTSEDCLSLNVWTPGLDGRRPVMVWLHGGAWGSCAGSAPGFDGTALAQGGDVVVVTLNHRLNLFGYIQLEGDERFAQSANAGALDLVAALRWVQANAAAFGGDPGNVTIFGQSGGGAKVSALLAMPAARGLFHRAIAQSCSGSLRLAAPDAAARLSHGLATTLGLPRATGEALLALPVDTLVTALQKQPPMFRPVRDGTVFPADPFDPAAPAAGVPVMFGNAATEATLYMAADMRNFSLDAAEVTRRLSRFLQTDAAETARIMDAYGAAAPSPSDVMAAVATDYSYRRNTTREAALYAARGGAAYAYVFDWRTPVRGGVLRTPHTAEVPFVFGTAPAAAALVGDGPDIPRLTAAMIATWSAFARAGSPANAAIPDWPRYDPAGRATMMLGTDSHVTADPGGEARRALDRLPFFEYSMPVNYAKA